MRERRIQTHTATQFFQFQACLRFLQSSLTDIEARTLRTIINGVNPQPDIGQGIVHETATTIVNVQTTYLIRRCLQINISLAGHSMSQISINMQRVTRHVDSQSCTADADAVGIDTPAHRSRCRVDGSCITQGNVKVSVCQAGTIHLCQLVFQINTVGTQP